MFEQIVLITGIYLKKKLQPIFISWRQAHQDVGFPFCEDGGENGIMVQIL